MGRVFFITVLLGGLNLYLYLKARRLIFRWRSGPVAERWLLGLQVWFLLINSPYVALTILRWSGSRLHEIPEFVLTWFFYPFYAWVGMLVAFLLLSFPFQVASGIVAAGRWLFRRGTPNNELSITRRQPVPETVLARRRFLATAAAVVPPVLYAISARAVYGSDELEVSPPVDIPVRGLPRAFDGLTITQLSDLHVGAYIRQRELARVVDAANGIGSDLMVITGDILDGSLEMLPMTQEAVARLRAPLGVYGNLGNHDYYADRRRDGYPGCLRVMEGLEAAGVRMLRNQRVMLGKPGDQLVLAGLDWTGMMRGSPNLYQPNPTRDALTRTFEGDETGAPRLLLVHHPHVFFEATDFRVALTLAGHTHGGGQVVIAENNGRPLTLGSAVFRFLKGLYQDGDQYLYVNRGIGFVGLPIRIQCPPEISRFRLVRS